MKEKLFTRADVYKYISGSYMPDELVEKLESDPDFICKVIEVSKDKNTYLLSDDNIKYNRNVILKVFDVFSDDIDFSFNVLKDFERNNSSLIDLIELKIKLLEKHSKKNDIRVKNISKDVDDFYRDERENQIYSINCEPKENIRNSYEMGFVFVLDEYKDRPVISDLFASRMYNEIFNKVIDSNLAMYIHNKYDSPEVIIDGGINHELVGVIYDYDSNLGKYLTAHSYLLNDNRKELLNIINRWDSYRNCNNEDILDIIHDYYELDEPHFSEIELASYVENKYGINKLVFDYCYGDEELMKGSKSLPELSIDEKSKLSVLDNKLKSYFSGEKLLLKDKVLEYKQN